MYDDDEWLAGNHIPPYIPILVLLLTLCVSGWASCTYNGNGYIAYNTSGSGYVSCQYGTNCTGRLCSTTGQCTASCDIAIVERGGAFYTNFEPSGQNSPTCTNAYEGCAGTTANNYASCWAKTRCTTECEAKEQDCIAKGGSWDAENCECKTCPNDTTWNSEKSCSGPNGAGLYVNSFYEHTIKDCQETVIKHTWQAASCDTIKDSTYKCFGTVNGHTVMMKAPSGATFNCEADGSCQFAMNKIASGECGPSPGPNPNSSNSNNSSSSQEQSSSSQEQSSSSDDEEPNSSETQQQNSSNSVSVAELPQRLYDSLGAIDNSIQWYQVFVSGIYDGVWEMSGTAHDINTNTRNTSNYVLEMKDTLHNTNQLLKQIANKDFSPDIHVGAPDVNIDVSGIQSNQNETRDSLHNTNNLLEDIKGLLGSSGSDTIHVDTSKAPASIDSALKHWGNKSNQTFAAAGLDSSGWGNTNDSAGAATDSVLSRADFFGSLGCDTTGGKKCDGSIIGADGLETATGSMKATYGELRDSLTSGAFADSLRLWGNKFTGNGTLTGSGSNSCPSVLTKTYRVDIYKGAGYNFTLGTYLCAPLFGQTTAWSLCRMLLRATIALACMWFLFKCATGFGGGGDE